MYNISNGTGNLTNAQDLAQYMTWVNSATGGWLGNVIVAIVFILALILLNRNQSGEAFIGSSFIAFMTALLLSLIGVVNGWVVVITFMMLAVSIIANR